MLGMFDDVVGVKPLFSDVHQHASPPHRRGQTISKTSEANACTSIPTDMLQNISLRCVYLLKVHVLRVRRNNKIKCKEKKKVE